MIKVWKKLGQIYVPRSHSAHPKLVSHAANPLAMRLDGDIFRIFYSGRDSSNRSSVGAVDINIKSRKVVAEHDEPFFEHGPAGSFFADGVSVGSFYEVDGLSYMLFMGWQRPENGHWRGDIGRLTVSPELTLELESCEPFMGCTPTDPISLSYPWVHRSASGLFDMWYGSTLSWDAGNGEMLHVIHHAHSVDGHNWDRNGLAIPYELGYAQAFSRPTVLQNNDGLYEMWFSYRCGTGMKYRIGYARFCCDIGWVLDLESAGIDVSLSGWDSEMIEYPFVFDHDGSRYMLYNGNGYGATGFGLASLESCT
jgi:hypothetical protein